MKGGPFTISLPRPDLALGGFSDVPKKWTDQCEVCDLKKKVTVRVGPLKRADTWNIEGPTIVKLSHYHSAKNTRLGLKNISLNWTQKKPCFERNLQKIFQQRLIVLNRITQKETLRSQNAFSKPTLL